MRRIIKLATAAIGYWRIIVAVAGMAGLVAVWWQYRAGLIEQGQDECRAKVEQAIAMQQAIADQQSIEYEAGRAERQTETRYRTREVIKYVEADRACDWSPGALRVLNNAITGAEPAGESGQLVPGPTDYRITKPASDSPLDRHGSRDVPRLPSAPSGNR